MKVTRSSIRFFILLSLTIGFVGCADSDFGLDVDRNNLLNPGANLEASSGTGGGGFLEGGGFDLVFVQNGDCALDGMDLVITQYFNDSENTFGQIFIDDLCTELREHNHSIAQHITSFAVVQDDELSAKYTVVHYALTGAFFALEGGDNQFTEVCEAIDGSNRVYSFDDGRVDKVVMNGAVAISIEAFDRNSLQESLYHCY